MAGHHEEKPDEGLSVPEDTQMAPGATPPAESGLSELGPAEAEAPRGHWRPGPLTPVWVIGVLIVLLVIALAFYAGVG
jgi:hypothetical protein